MLKLLFIFSFSFLCNEDHYHYGHLVTDMERTECKKSFQCHFSFSFYPILFYFSRLCNFSFPPCATKVNEIN